MLRMKSAPAAAAKPERPPPPAPAPVSRRTTRRAPAAAPVMPARTQEMAVIAAAVALCSLVLGRWAGRAAEKRAAAAAAKQAAEAAAAAAERAAADREAALAAAAAAEAASAAAAAEEEWRRQRAEYEAAEAVIQARIVRITRGAAELRAILEHAAHGHALPSQPHDFLGGLAGEDSSMSIGGFSTRSDLSRASTAAGGGAPRRGLVLVVWATRPVPDPRWIDPFVHQLARRHPNLLVALVNRGDSTANDRLTADAAVVSFVTFQFYRGYRRVGEVVGSEAIRGKVERALAAHVEGRPLGPASPARGMVSAPVPSPDRASPWRRWRT